MKYGWNNTTIQKKTISGADMNGQQQSMDVKKILDGSLFFFRWKIKKNRKKPSRNWLWYNVCNYGETKIKYFIKEDFLLSFIIWIDTKICKKKKSTTETPRNQL